ncbi:MAG: glycosyltransferase [Thermoproteota archaeon]
MKVLHANNTANFAYYIVKTLRSAGINADLLMQKYPLITADPKGFDKEMQEYPDWILFWDNKSEKWKSEIKRHIKDKKYDLIHAYGEFPMYAYLSRRPFLAHSLGSDMRKLAFAHSIRGILLRRAYHKAKAVIYSSPDQYNHVVKLGLKNSIFLPTPWDYDKFTPQKVDRGDWNDKFVIFHPTNLNYSSKGNETFLRAFVRFSKELDCARLLLVDRGQDAQRVKEFLTTSGVIDKVKLISGPLAQNEMYYYYNISDVVVDQFIVGSVGLIALETMSCAKPLIGYIDEGLYASHYELVPPILNCKDENAVYKALMQLSNSSSLGDELGKKGREWTVRYHSKDMFAKRCKGIYDGILANRDIRSIRDSL